jgi:hypothetical protein
MNAELIVQNSKPISAEVHPGKEELNDEFEIAQTTSQSKQAST